MYHEQTRTSSPAIAIIEPLLHRGLHEVKTKFSFMLQVEHPGQKVLDINEVTRLGLHVRLGE